MFCESCGSPVPDGQSFCPNCGAPVTQAAPAAQPVQPVSQPVYQQPVAQPVYQQPVYQVQPVVMSAPEQPVRKTNGFGIAGLILGILTLVTCWIPIVPLFFGFFGLILCIIGLCMKNAGKGQAIAGLVMTLIGVVIGVVMILFLYGVVGSYVDKAAAQEEALQSSIAESLDLEELIGTSDTEETEAEEDAEDSDSDDEDDSDDDED